MGSAPPMLPEPRHRDERCLSSPASFPKPGHNQEMLLAFPDAVRGGQVSRAQQPGPSASSVRRMPKRRDCPRYLHSESASFPGSRARHNRSFPADAKRVLRGRSTLSDPAPGTVTLRQSVQSLEPRAMSQTTTGQPAMLKIRQSAELRYSRYCERPAKHQIREGPRTWRSQI